jgi:glyoxylase-like metal-dependent hydrolase (beta-lactamase superfamily II)
MGCRKSGLCDKILQEGKINFVTLSNGGIVDFQRSEIYMIFCDCHSSTSISVLWHGKSKRLRKKNYDVVAV